MKLWLISITSVIKKSSFTYLPFIIPKCSGMVLRGSGQLLTTEYVGFLEINICLKETKTVLIVAFVFQLEL